MCGFEIPFPPVVLASGLQLDIQLDFVVKGIRFYSQVGPEQINLPQESQTSLALKISPIPSCATHRRKPTQLC